VMRNLLAENLEKAATRRTVAAITERNPGDGIAEVVQVESDARPTAQAQSGGHFAPAMAEPAISAARSNRPVAPPFIAAAAAAAPLPQAKPEPAPLTSGVIQGQALATIPGSSEPMKPVRVKTVQVKAGLLKVASADAHAATPVTSGIPAQVRPPVSETSTSVVAKAETSKADLARVDVPRIEMPPQPLHHGTGNGLLGVLPASSVPSSSAMAYADPVVRSPPQAAQQNATKTGWIVQVGALESESEAMQRIEAARNQARGLLAKADPFTEQVVAKGDKKLYRARFAGLDRDQAEAVCKTLKRSEISCITIRN